MSETTIRVYPAKRPFLLTFPATGSVYPLTSEEAERLIAEYPLLSATRNRVTLRADDGQRCTITPATLGGGDAFEVVRSRYVGWANGLDNRTNPKR